MTLGPTQEQAKQSGLLAAAATDFFGKFSMSKAQAATLGLAKRLESIGDVSLEPALKRACKQAEVKNLLVDIDLDAFEAQMIPVAKV